VLDVSGSTITPATPAVFESASSDSLSVVALSLKKTLVVYGDNGNSGYPTACVLDVSGSTITPATAVALDNAATTGSSTVMVSATQALTVYNQAADTTYATVLDVSGSVITPATPVNTNIDDGDPQPAFLLSLSSTLFVAAGSSNDFSVLTLSGSVVTANQNRSTMFANITENNSAPLYLHKLSATRFATVFPVNDGDTQFYGGIFDVGLTSDGSEYGFLQSSFGQITETIYCAVPNSDGFNVANSSGVHAFATNFCTLSTGKILLVGQDYAQAAADALVVEIVA